MGQFLAVFGYSQGGQSSAAETRKSAYSIDLRRLCVHLRVESTKNFLCNALGSAQNQAEQDGVPAYPRQKFFAARIAGYFRPGKKFQIFESSVGHTKEVRPCTSIQIPNISFFSAKDEKSRKKFLRF